MTYEHLSPAAIERADWLVVLTGNETGDDAQHMGEAAALDDRPASDNPFDEEDQPDLHAIWDEWYANAKAKNDDNEDRDPGC